MNMEKFHVGDVYKYRLYFDKTKWKDITEVSYVKTLEDVEFLKPDPADPESMRTSYKILGNLKTNPELVDKLNSWDRWEYTNPIGQEKTISNIVKAIKDWNKPMNKNKEKLDSFTEYCKAHPEQRFWQALRNWHRDNFDADANFILTAEVNVDAQVQSLWTKEKDTFYIE